MWQILLQLTPEEAAVAALIAARAPAKVGCGDLFASGSGEYLSTLCTTHLIHLPPKSMLLKQIVL